MKSATISSYAGPLHNPASAPPGQVHLTPRQLEVLSLLCEGLPNKLICRELNIAAGTVKVHIGVILRELGVTSRLQAVVAASRRGLVGESGGSAPRQPAFPGVAGSPVSLHTFLSARSASTQGAAS